MLKNILKYKNIFYKGFKETLGEHSKGRDYIVPSYWKNLDMFQ